MIFVIAQFLIASPFMPHVWANADAIFSTVLSIIYVIYDWFLIWLKDGQPQYVTLFGGPSSGMKVVVYRTVACPHGYVFQPDGNNRRVTEYTKGREWYRIVDAIAAYTPPAGARLPGMPEQTVSRTLSQACAILSQLVHDPVVGNVVEQLYGVATTLLYQEDRDTLAEAAFYEQVVAAALRSGKVATTLRSVRDEVDLAEMDRASLGQIITFLSEVVVLEASAKLPTRIAQGVRLELDNARSRRAKQQEELERQAEQRERDGWQLLATDDMKDTLAISASALDALGE